ncbi:cyclic pyranopterin monophosphate synthase MoaC [Nocardia abscessus]|uniref:Cyclic pyranopterin monophosphate synthase MoaC n=1 Tax=Nocardia abscessus TaxID=120957 RepID=A0ABS0CJN5_9NOCA|nr:cyclic pyranopterin monophosphate synthase MoaC [Nocardia abscessus]MBF6228779.1 cyclic pyranopterin monophosphate synthase MoaC [Nocardia abscessus]
MSELSHVDGDGRARMVDVSAKADSARTAVAAGELRTTPEAVAILSAGNARSSEILATARLSGIIAAKRTSELIPLCHQLALSAVTVEFEFREGVVAIEATAKTCGPTGVEMEALTAVTVAGLNLNYMLKAVAPASTLDAIRLLTKDGGKSGSWVRSDPSALSSAPHGSLIQLHDAGSRALPLYDSTK